MKTKLLLLLLFSQMVAQTLASASNQNSVPQDLSFNGKPIDSLCFFNEESTSITVDLNQCGAVKSKYKTKAIDLDLSKKGYFGYNWEDDSFTSVFRGYSYYKYIDAGNKQYWIYTVNGTGGSGEFSGILLVQRKNKNTLLIQEVIGGDRCNGGIQDVTGKNQTLSYSVNITPFDFISLADKKIPGVEAYDGLAACAACCVGKLFYEISATLKPKLTSIVLGKTTQPVDLPDQGSYQACFNTLYISYISKNEVLFNQEKINEFANRFYKTCVKPNSNKRKSI